MLLNEIAIVGKEGSGCESSGHLVMMRHLEVDEMIQNWFQNGQ